MEPPARAAAVARVVDACRRTGKIPGFATGSAEEAVARATQGSRFLTAGTDARFLQQGAAGAAATVAGAR